MILIMRLLQLNEHQDARVLSFCVTYLRTCNDIVRPSRDSVERVSGSKSRSPTIIFTKMHTRET